MSTFKTPKLGAFQEDLYAAEVCLRGGRVFKDIRQVREYVNTLVASDDFQVLWPDVYEVHVERRSSSASWSFADCDSNAIYLADITQTTVLHELAHLCTPGDCHGHGPEFARVYLTLVRWEMGFHAYGALLSALRGTGAFRGSDLTPIDTGV